MSSRTSSFCYPKVSAQTKETIDRCRKKAHALIYTPSRNEVMCDVGSRAQRALSHLQKLIGRLPDTKTPGQQLSMLNGLRMLIAKTHVVRLTPQIEDLAQNGCKKHRDELINDFIGHFAQICQIYQEHFCRSPFDLES